MGTVSNPATLLSVESALGEPYTSLLSVKRGGTIVPNLTTYSGINASTPRLSEFAGKVFPAANSSAINSTGFDTAISTNNASFSFEIRSDGLTKSYVGGIENHSGTWLLSGTASNYEARVTKTAGDDLTSGTQNTWQALSSTRSWGLTETRNGFYSKTFTGTLEIRDASTLVAAITAKTVSMEVTVEV